MDSSGLSPTLFVVLVIFIVAGILYWSYRRSHEILQRWARQNGYRILQANLHYFFMGPFFWTTSKGQTVFRVEVEDVHGIRRRGWVRCGSWWWGLLTDKVEARWDN